MITCASTAQADMSYKWVELSAQQMRANKGNCDSADLLLDTAGKVGVAVGSLSVTATMITGAENNRQRAGIATTVGVGLTSLGVGAFELYKIYFKSDEIMALIFELQSNRPGLMVEKLQQVALENNVDANRLLAGLNLRAVRSEVCSLGGRAVHGKDLENLLGQESVQQDEEQPTQENIVQEAAMVRQLAN